MPTANDSLPTTEVPFGYREALAQVIAELTESEAKRLEAERAVWRARYHGRSVLLDQRPQFRSTHGPPSPRGSAAARRSGPSQWAQPTHLR